MLNITDVKRIYLGVQGENLAQSITIDVRPWLVEYPGGSVTIWHKRNGDSVPTPTGAVFDPEEGTITWSPTATDTYVSGEGEAEIRLSTGEVIKKSRTVITGVSPSVTLAGEPLESGWQSYIGAMEQMSGEAVSAKNSAELAQEAAETAQGLAEEARDAAQAAAGDFRGLTASASALAPGSNPTVQVTHSEGGLFKMAFGIPRGEKGDDGDPAPAEEVQTAVDAYLDQVITNPDSPPLDRTLSSSSGAAPADLVGSIKSETTLMPINKVSDAEDIDLDITDPNGNVILRLEDGHIKTKEFDSEEIKEDLEDKQDKLTFDIAPTEGSNNPVTSEGIHYAIQSVKGDAQLKASDAANVDLDLTDEDGNVIMRLSGGHLETEGFDSRDAAGALNDTTDARSTPLFTTIDYWEPEEADSGYSNPTEDWGGDTKRADWTAENKYYYYEFLAHYYDVYLGTYSDGYRVTKRSLGQDSEQNGHELFEYDFCPLNYKYTILFSAGMNADETQGIWGLATFMRAIMNEEETNMAIAHNNIRFKVIPIINASGFDKASLRYTYSDGVNPNFNFNYKDSWSRNTATTTQKGAYPDSNVSTVILKKWINENAWKASLWVDLHTGRWPNSYPSKKILDVRVADSSMVGPFSTYVELIKAYYAEKGYIESTDNIGGAESIRSNVDYQKTVYAFDVCGIKSIMPEMHLECIGYGADGNTNNSVAGIKCYAGQLRAMMMCYINESVSSSGIKLDSMEYVRLHAKEV